MTDKQHPGISMHKLPVGGGFIGLLFAVGSALVFVLGLPALWYFVAFSAALGIGIALLMRIAGARLSNRAKPLSILSTSSKTATEAQRVEDRRNRLHSSPTLIPA
jgi:membrane protein implicated in regulation of membrane protease activity